MLDPEDIKKAVKMIEESRTGREALNKIFSNLKTLHPPGKPVPKVIDAISGGPKSFNSGLCLHGVLAQSIKVRL